MYANVKTAEAAARKADAGLFAKMVKGAGGAKRRGASPSKATGAGSIQRGMGKGRRLSNRGLWRRRRHPCTGLWGMLR